MLNIGDFFNLINNIKIKAKSSEYVSLNNAIGRILTNDIICKYNIPRFDNSAMDGYAIKSGYHSYDIIDSTFAGDNRVIDINNNEACKINTGSRIPNGADCVVQQELVKISNNIFQLDVNPQVGLNIKFKGEDFKEGSILLSKGSRIDSKGIALLASQGINNVEVNKTPKIIIFGSGDEIVPLDIFGSKKGILNNNQLFDTNSIFLQSIFRDFCFEYGGVIRDNKNEILNTLKNAIGKYDIIITIGGASVGSKDYIYNTLKELGANIIVNGLNIKPGKPLKLSSIDNTYILSLPGNPIASFVTSMLILPHIATRFSGGSACYLSYDIAVNKTYFKLKHNVCNIVLGNIRNGEFVIFNNGKYQNSSLLPLMFSNSFAIFNNSVEEVLSEDKIKVISYDYIFLDTIPDIINGLGS